jgi:Spy/CpxP family protein refolding chaperone
MSKLLKTFCLVGLTVLLAVPVLAQERQPGQRGRGARGAQQTPFALPRGLEVTDEQKAKIAEIEKKYADKWKDATEKAKLTDEQTAARREAFTKARADNLQGEDLQKAIADAVTLTDDQKKGQEAMTALRAEVAKEIEALLTDEQKAKLKELQEQRGRRGTRGARPTT